MDGAKERNQDYKKREIKRTETNKNKAGVLLFSAQVEHHCSYSCSQGPLSMSKFSYKNKKNKNKMLTGGALVCGKGVSAYANQDDDGNENVTKQKV